MSGSITAKLLPPWLQAIHSTMPKHDGHVKCPDYVPERHRTAYKTELGKWCRNNDRETWPEWVRQYVDGEKARAPHKAETQSVHGTGATIQNQGDDPG